MMLFRNQSFVSVYLDNLLVLSCTIQEHYQHINTVLEILERTIICINFEKSTFCKNKVTYLGHEISENDIRADLSRIDKLDDFKN